MTVSNDEIASRYVRRGLELIRVANGLSRDAESELSRLAREIRALLLGEDVASLGKRSIEALIREIADAVSARYGAISATQAEALAELVRIEAEFAQRAAGWAKSPSATALDAAIAGILVMGASPGTAWQKQAADIAYRMAAELRGAAAAGADAKAVTDAVIGAGPAGRERGGPIDAARRAARSLVDTSAHAAANRGRFATFRANGVQAVKWHAVLDSRVCPYCGAHAGKLWTLDGGPIGHDAALGPHPPAHWWCRCILLPMRWPGGPPEDGGEAKDTFADWLGGLAPHEQDDILGAGRAGLWRRGAITLTDLIGQNGRTMTLAELRARTT